MTSKSRFPACSFFRLLRKLSSPAAIVVLACGAARGEALVVNSLGDSHALNAAAGPQDATGSITLRSAIEHANQTLQADTITFAPTLGSPATIGLDPSLGPVLVSRSTLIEGPGADQLEISGRDQTRLFRIQNLPGETCDIGFRGVAVTHGYSQVQSAAFLVASSSGTAVTLTFERCLLADHRSDDTGHAGTVFFCVGGPAITARNCTFTRNVAAGYGAILSMTFRNAHCSLEQSTLTGNSALAGAVAFASADNATLDISNCTIVENTNAGYANLGWDGPCRIKSSIVAGTSGTGFDIAIPQLASGGHNLFGRINPITAGGFAPSDITDVTLEQLALRELQWDGGGVPTRLPVSASLVIDRGACDDLDGNTLLTDQRGAPRRVRFACDVGAVETPSECPPTDGVGGGDQGLAEALAQVAALQAQLAAMGQQIAVLQGQLSQCRGETIREGVFYNRSSWDGKDPAANALDDQAIAADKHALLPGGTATFENYTSYSRGLNGLMIDVHSLPGSPTTADFAFKVGNDSHPENWHQAPEPSAVAVRRGQGGNGADRITVVWPDQAIQGQWLEVTVLPGANTGLVFPHIFYFGNAVGEVGNNPDNALVNAADEGLIRTHPRSLLNPAGLDDRYDINRDRKVDAADQLLCRRNSTLPSNALRLVSLPTF